MSNIANEQVNDDKLWRIAKKRAAFKMQCMVYILVNGLQVGLWYFTTGGQAYFWPIWSILGWGFGIVYQFIDAYMGNTLFSKEKEFEKLKNKQ